MTDLKDKRVAVLGFGAEGSSAAKFLQREGAKVTICDQKTDIETSGFDSILGVDYLDKLDDFDIIVPSPGVQHSKIKTHKPIVSPTQLFFERCLSPIIGVTGTKGKGTTTTLITRMLETVGNTVHLGGNIGTPALDFIDEVTADDWVVLELSSFQLYDMTVSPHIAVVLMIEPDHMDWHPDMDDYVSAKAHIVEFQHSDDVAIYHASNKLSRKVGEKSPGRQITYLGPDGAHIDGDNVVIAGDVVCRVDEVGLIGQHNLENVCAALTAAWQVEHRPAEFAQAIREFKGLEHRLEFVREIDGVRYYNDSFSTNPSAAIAALSSFQEPIILIAGGADKGAEFTELAKIITEKPVKKTLLVGQTANDLADALTGVGYKNYEILDGNMQDFVKTAENEASEGDVVLMSPACASFGLFDSYKQRGELFRNAVADLGKHAGNA